MFSTEERKARRDLRQSIKLQLPMWTQHHVDERLRYAVYTRDAARRPGLDPAQRDHLSHKAMVVLGEVRDLLCTYLFDVRRRAAA